MVVWNVSKRSTPLLRQGVYRMTSIELKHQARLQEWSAAVKDCRSSGISVRQWCRERGITTTTYYRWERELLAAANTTPALPTAVFAELPRPKQVSRNVSECSATLHIGSGSIMFHQELSAELLKAIVEALRSC